MFFKKIDMVNFDYNVEIIGDRMITNTNKPIYNKLDIITKT